MNLTAYRLPNEDFSKRKIYLCGDMEPAVFESGRNGFVISPFFPSYGHFLYPFIDRLNHVPVEIVKDNYIDFDFKCFSKQDYKDYLREILKTLNNDLEKKIVASRRMSIPKVVNPGDLFNALCLAYPHAFVFLISTKEFGTWVGASPETLLQKRGSDIYTMALAGTRLHTTEEEKQWDTKNIKEQKIVADFIASCFSQNDINVIKGDTVTQRAGNIEHIMTPIQGKISERVNICRLLSDLSPTPALSGCPRKTAIEIIKKYEKDRILYGGFSGPLFTNGDFHFNVVLRCAYISPYESILFAGGGITSLSEFDAEWQEIENKFFTLGRFF